MGFVREKDREKSVDEATDEKRRSQLAIDLKMLEKVTSWQVDSKAEASLPNKTNDSFPGGSSERRRVLSKQSPSPSRELSRLSNKKRNSVLAVQTRVEVNLNDTSLRNSPFHKVG